MDPDAPPDLDGVFGYFLSTVQVEASTGRFHGSQGFFVILLSDPGCIAADGL